MSTLYTRSIDICKGISVRVPTVGEILEDDEAYYSLAYRFSATPYDMMVQLDDAGIDCTQVNDFDIFCFMFPYLQTVDVSMILGNVSLRDFQVAYHEPTKSIILRDETHDLTIDRPIHYQIAQAVRKILDIPRNTQRPGNEDARKYLIDRERKRLKRAKASSVSPLDNYIIAMVNTANFPYDYESVKDLTIYQFSMSLKQIAHLTNYQNVMRGYYAGTIKLEDIPAKERTWILNRE